MTNRQLVDYQLSTLAFKHYFQQGYNGLTLLSVLQGEIRVFVGSSSQILKAGDVLLINQYSAYQIDSEIENIVIKLEIASHYFVHHYSQYFHTYFKLNSQDCPEFKKRYIDSVCLLLAKMNIIAINNDNEAMLENHRILSEIMLILVHFFQEKLDSSFPNHEYSPRITRIIQYISANHQNKVSLQQIAKQEFVSFSYLSRLFKQEVGMSFMHYLTKVKFEHAVFLLLNTSKPVYQIAEEQGFSSTKKFITLFKQTYQQTPKQYRTQQSSIVMSDEHHLVVPKKENKVTSIKLDDLLPLLSEIMNTTNQYDSELKKFSKIDKVVFDVNSQPKNRSVTLKKLNYIITIGELPHLLKHDVQAQILSLLQDCHVDYIDVEKIISGDAIQDEFITDETTPTYSFYGQIESAIDFLFQHDIALFIRIYHDSVNQNSHVYQQKIVKFLNHCLNRYGVDYVQRWKFIYSTAKNNSAKNGFIENSQLSDSQLLSQYRFIRSHIKMCLPKSRVGFYHPLLTDEKQFQAFIQSELSYEIDFLGYEIDVNHYIDPDNVTESQLDYIGQKSKQIKMQLKKNKIDIPLVLLKWNTFTGHTWQTNGRYFRGALIAHALLSLTQHIESIAFILNYEVQQLKSSIQQVEINSVALYHQFNTKRPLYYVLKLLDKMQGEVVVRSENCIVTKTQQGYQLLLLNISLFNPYLSIQEHLTENFRKQQIIKLENIPNGNYQVRKYLLDQKHGALYIRYDQFLTKYGRDQEMIDYINQTTTPYFEVHDRKVQDDTWETLAEMETNAIRLYELKRIYE